MNIYTGYIYLWYDTKAKFFYLGGHKGRIEDYYVCSSKMMLRAYKKRPETFKFRVLEYVYGCNKDLREAEQKWLNLIKDTELYWTPNIYNNTCKYYNQKKHASGGNGSANKGQKRGPAWSKGYSKKEIILRNKGLLSFFPLDAPKKLNVELSEPKSAKKLNVKLSESKSAKKTSWKFTLVFLLTCEKCLQVFYHKKKTIRFCSRSCRCSHAASLVKTNGMKNIETRKKYSNQITGRKMEKDANGHRHWAYPINRGVYLTEHTPQSSE